jgi:defect-in-organelle-trafficking protein DotC
LEQAQLIWENNLNELVRDIRGRITFRVLENRGVVQSPQMVGSVPQMTQSDTGETLNAGDSVYSITVPAEFQAQQQWQPLWRASNGQEAQLVQDHADLMGGTPRFSEPKE